MRDNFHKIDSYLAYYFVFMLSAVFCAAKKLFCDTIVRVAGALLFFRFLIKCISGV